VWLKLLVITVSTLYKEQNIAPNWFCIDLASAYGLAGLTACVSLIGISLAGTTPYSSAEPTSRTRVFSPDSRM
jgi:hypothetical protein